MYTITYNQVFLFLAFIGGLWAGDRLGDQDGNASINSIIICGIIAVAIGFIIDVYRQRNKNTPS